MGSKYEDLQEAVESNIDEHRVMGMEKAVRPAPGYYAWYWQMIFLLGCHLWMICFVAFSLLSLPVYISICSGNRYSCPSSSRSMYGCMCLTEGWYFRCTIVCLYSFHRYMCCYFWWLNAHMSIMWFYVVILY